MKTVLSTKEFGLKFVGSQLVKADTVGACLSLACAIHCICMPLLLVVLPVLGLGFFLDPIFEAAILASALMLALITFCCGSLIHKELKIFAFIVIAVGLFVVGHESINRVQGGILLGAGGVVLSLGHLLNRKLCKTCQVCSH